MISLTEVSGCFYTNFKDRTLKSPLELSPGEGKGAETPSCSISSRQWGHPISFQHTKATYETQEEVVSVLEVTTEGIDPFHMLGIEPCCCCLP